MTELFNEVLVHPYRRRNNETRDCVVIALALISESDYQDVHKFIEGQGREVCKPIPLHGIIRTLEKTYKWKFNKISEVRKPNGSRYSAMTITDFLKPTSKAICTTCNHALAVINGTVQDWSYSYRLRIVSVYELKRIGINFGEMKL